MTVREILKILYKDGWKDVNSIATGSGSGSHIQLKHPTKTGKVTVPNHKGDIAPGTLNSILKQAGLK